MKIVPVCWVCAAAFALMSEADTISTMTKTYQTTVTVSRTLFLYFGILSDAGTFAAPRLKSLDEKAVSQIHAGSITEAAQPSP